MSELPEWVEALRPQQVTAIAQIQEAYDRGVDVVALNGPTGSGKTLIAAMVQKNLGVRGTYVAHSLSLQDQFLGDFPEARVLKGRANYPTLNRPDLTAADCGGKACTYCKPVHLCPYAQAKNETRRAPIAVLNTAYFLGYRWGDFMRPFMVLDEADTLESILMSHCEFRLTASYLRSQNLVQPNKSVHTKTILEWLEELSGTLDFDVSFLRQEIKAAQKIALPPDPETTRELANVLRVQEAVETLHRELAAGDRPWVRDYSRPRDFTMKPVTVSAQGGELLWGRGSKGTKWLAMSASIIDPGEWTQSVGVETAGLKWDSIDLPNVWPAANRPIVAKMFGDMSRSGSEAGKRRVIDRTVEICAEHQKHGENVLVHAVSYWLTAEIVRALIDAGIVAWTYEKSRERDRALGRFKSTGGVLVAPSLDRGVDLPDELCRCQVIAKVPFPNLGDRQVAERMRMADGERWYAVQTARTLLQMTGRGIRHADDRAVTYILDRAFSGYYGKWSRLLPRWWRDSIVNDLPKDWFLR
jgi:Rad3-related DNA helicase